MFIHIKDRTTEQTYPNGTRTAQIRAQTAPSIKDRTTFIKDRTTECSQTRRQTGKTQYP